MQATLLFHTPKPFWGVNKSFAEQEATRLLRNPKVHCRVEKPATGLYPEPGESSPYNQNLFSEDAF
jgi:hypothetical protein